MAHPLHPHEAPPIRDYALIGDCHSAGLVSRAGSVDWCCFQRFDRKPVFARLLDWEKGGHFHLGPEAEAQVERSYRRGTNVLTTRFRTARGTVTLHDAFSICEEPDHTGVCREPPMELVRVARCEEGEVRLVVDFRPRFEYGLTTPCIERRAEDLFIVYGGPETLSLETDADLQRTGEARLGAVCRLAAGEQRRFVVRSMPPHQVRLERLGAAATEERLTEAERFWRSWGDRCSYDGPYRDAVLRSALVLKALTNAPTGALVAAPTTSLPECPGGERNWDYRYTWLRDADMHLDALFGLGYTDEGNAFMEWLERTTAGRARDLQVMYGVGGERFLPEVPLAFLSGYRGAHPVRIGNQAATQFQLDVYGHVLETAWDYHRRGGAIDEEFWGFLCDIVAVVAEEWQRPDHGMWEVRCAPRHFVLSKVMAWVAVDRALRLAEELRLPADHDAWSNLRDRIRATIEEKGIDRKTGGFARSFGSHEVDAALLVLPLVGFLPPTDPRILATLDQVERRLMRNGLIYRYQGEDGLSGEEGAFVATGFWMVAARALAGQVEPATALFERLLGLTNDVGLLAEEIEPVSGAFLGNFPQALSHIGIIHAALILDGRSAGGTILGTI